MLIFLRAKVAIFRETAKHFKVKSKKIAAAIKKSMHCEL